jgi:hypothetical protein
MRVDRHRSSTNKICIGARNQNGVGRLPRRVTYLCRVHVGDEHAWRWTSHLVRSEAFRVLRSRGRLCRIGLAHGRSGVRRIVTELWERIWRFKPEVLGGCRPVDLGPFLAAQEWSIDSYKVVTFFWH